MDYFKFPEHQRSSLRKVIRTSLLHGHSASLETDFESLSHLSFKLFPCLCLLPSTQKHWNKHLSSKLFFLCTSYLHRFKNTQTCTKFSFFCSLTLRSFLDHSVNLILSNHIGLLKSTSEAALYPKAATRLLLYSE